jgi:hypothetical protein
MEQPNPNQMRLRSRSQKKTQTKIKMLKNRILSQMNTSMLRVILIMMKDFMMITLMRDQRMRNQIQIIVRSLRTSRLLFMMNHCNSKLNQKIKYNLIKLLLINLLQILLDLLCKEMRKLKVNL